MLETEGIWFTTTRSRRYRSEAGRTGKEKDRNAGNGLSYAGADPWRTCFHLYMESEGWGSERIYSGVLSIKSFWEMISTNNYVMLMNDPSREFYKCYEIDFDRHRYDGKNWTYVNLPIEGY